MCALFSKLGWNSTERKLRSAMLTREQVQELEPLFLSVVSAYRNKLLQPEEQICRYLFYAEAAHITEDMNARALATSVPAPKLLGFLTDRYIAARLEGIRPDPASDEELAFDAMPESSRKAGEDPRLAILTLFLQDRASMPLAARPVLFSRMLHLVKTVICYYRRLKKIPDSPPRLSSAASCGDTQADANFDQCFPRIINALISKRMDPAMQLAGFLETGDSTYIPTADGARRMALSLGTDIVFPVITAGLEGCEWKRWPDCPEKTFLQNLVRACGERGLDPAGQLIGYVISKDPKYLPKSFRTQCADLLSSLGMDELVCYLLRMVI